MRAEGMRTLADETEEAATRTKARLTKDARK